MDCTAIYYFCLLQNKESLDQWNESVVEATDRIQLEMTSFETRGVAMDHDMRRLFEEHKELIDALTKKKGLAGSYMGARSSQRLDARSSQRIDSQSLASVVTSPHWLLSTFTFTLAGRLVSCSFVCTKWL